MMDNNQGELDKVFSALNDLFLAELVKLSEGAAESVTRIHAAGGDIKYEIGMRSRSIVCKVQRERGSASVIVFHSECASPNGTSVPTPKSD